MPGHSPGIALPYDPAWARRLLAEAGYPGGYGFPAVDCLTPGAMVPQAEYLQAQWREELGVEIALECPEWGTLLERLRNEPPHMFIMAWGADYADPDSFLRVGLLSESIQWQNRTYDRLVEKARRVTDQAERMRLYRQADTILTQEAAILPLTYARLNWLIKPWVHKYPTSGMRWWFWESVILEPH
jgi:oligopeptide transport system substrate-binding protein